MYEKQTAQWQTNMTLESMQLQSAKTLALRVFIGQGPNCKVRDVCCVVQMFRSVGFSSIK